MISKFDTKAKTEGWKSANAVSQIEQRLQDSVLMKQWSKSINNDDDDDDDDIYIMMKCLFVCL